MTVHSEWLTNFDASKKTSIKLADNRKLASKGSGNIVMKSNFGGKVIIEDCWNKMCLTYPLSFDDNKVLKIVNWIC